MSRIAMRTTIQAVALSVIAMVIALTGGNAFALHRQTPFEEPIPFPPIQGAQSFRPFCQGQAARWQTFDSTTDLMHNGSSGDEIFLWDNDPAGPRHLVQVTNCGAGNSANPADDANGKTVVFESTSNLADPPSTRCTQVLPTRRIFRAQQVKGQFAYDELTGGLNPAADCSNAVITSEGFRVAFQCAGDLRGTGSTGTNIFLWRNDQVCDFNATPPCSDVQQITPPNGNWVSANPSFNLLSSMLIFNSNAPIDGDSNGSQQIWLYEISTNPPFKTPIRLTHGVGDSTNPTMSQDGRLVVFQSTADLLGTGSTGSQIFLLDRDTGILRQLTAAAGDSTLPSIGGGGRFIIFLSTGDFGSGSGGPHVFLYDLIDDVLYQVTNGAGSSGNPIATADTIFFFDSDEDPTKTGITGRQIYALNVFLQVPKRALGPAKFQLQPGHVDGHGVASGGSSVRLITESTFGANPQTSYITAPIGNPSTGPGTIGLSILGRNFDQEGAVTVPKMTIPPIPVPSFGAVCLQQTGTGKGTIDCNGDTGESQPDVLDYRTFQDHVTNDEDPNCQFGCKEGSECPGPITPPPAPDCPRCVSEPGVCADGPRQGQACEFDTQCPGREQTLDPITGTFICTPGNCGACDLTHPRNDDKNLPHLGTCIEGPRDGLWCDVNSECPSDCLAQQTCHEGATDTKTPCSLDRDCVADGQCTGQQLDICQGPSVLNETGSFGAGDMKLTIPMTAKFSTNAGPDGLYCTPDDSYALSGAGMDAELRLTTGKAAATITDVDYQQGLTMGASEQGAPFSCDRWENNQDLSGARLVGAVTFLNVPFVPFTHDTILTFRFVADSVQCIPGAGTCSKPCTADASCDDGDPCNGVEFCHLGQCQAGVPISCDDGNECNGSEVCDSANGGMCDKSPQQTCDATNPCTTGTCRPDFLCVYQNEPDGKACDDHNLCTGPDPVTGGTCTSVADCDACQNGVCTGLPTNVTPDCASQTNICTTGVMKCDPTTGTSCVQAVPPLTCVADANPCTDDGCDPTLGCNPPNTAPCDDMNACTGPDVCANRECHGDPTAAAQACVLGGTVCAPQACDPGSGACVVSPLNCDDANVCTDDTCNPDAATPADACVHTPNTAGCDDNNACTDGDTCVGGKCVGSTSAAAQACAASSTVCIPAHCDTASGACVATPLNCDDANPCTTDVCDPVKACIHTQLTGLCDDGNACTQGDECVNGACLGAPTPASTTCNDGMACNGIETCDPVSGACVAGTPLNCDDGDGCTTDTCDEKTGCANPTIDGLPGALCEIDVILDQLHASRPPTNHLGKLVSRRLLNRLTKLALRARVKVELASRASNPKAIKLLTGADNKLQQLIQKTNGAFQIDRITEALMHLVTDRSRSAREIVQAMKAALKGLKPPGTGGH
jgi:hypothetical protein